MDFPLTESEAIEEVKNLHKALNRKGLFPPYCYRRNHPDYLMISYANQIVALILSSYYEPVPVFIHRAWKEIEGSKGRQQKEMEEYRTMATAYLYKVTYFLSQFTDIEGDKISSMVPHVIYQVVDERRLNLDHPKP